MSHKPLVVRTCLALVPDFFFFVVYPCHKIGCLVGQYIFIKELSQFYTKTSSQFNKLQRENNISLHENSVGY